MTHRLSSILLPLLLALAVAPLSVRAGSSSASAAFTFDARYPALGGMPEEWDVQEVHALSGLFALRTRPVAADADGDGMPDWWERLCGLDPAVADADGDPDGDGRSNLQEYNAGTDPLAADDWALAAAASEAFRADTRVVYPGGLPVSGIPFAVYRVSNLFVCDTGGPPRVWTDSDGDGIPDWWAERYGGSPNGLDPDSDLDRDGFSAREEYTALTDPTDAGSLFEIALSAGGEGTNGSCRLVWNSAPGRLYCIHAAESLTGTWTNPPVATLEGTGLPLEYPLPAENGPLFLRVTVSLPGE